METIFILFMTATRIITLDKKSVHLNFIFNNKRMHVIFHFDARHVDKFTVPCDQTSAAQRNRCTPVQPFKKRWRNKRENLVMVTINAATFFASIWAGGGISAGSDSWGCTCGGWLILGDCDPCRCTTEINQKSNHALEPPTYTQLFHPPCEAFIKSTPLRPILEPLPLANIYHRLKVHLLIHQSFGDLRCLLEMDVVWRKHIGFTTWPNIKAKAFIKANMACWWEAFTPLPWRGTEGYCHAH